MPNLFKTLRMALVAALFALATGPVTPVVALASPYPFPMPFRAANYGSHLSPITHATRHSLVKRVHSSAVNAASMSRGSTIHKPVAHGPVNDTRSRHAVVHHSIPALRALRRQDDANMDVLLNALTARQDDMQDNANNFRKYLHTDLNSYLLPHRRPGISVCRRRR